MTINRKLCKLGHSRCVIIPATILEMLKFDENTKLLLSIKNNKIIIEKESSNGNS